MREGGGISRPKSVSDIGHDDWNCLRRIARRVDGLSRLGHDDFTSHLDELFGESGQPRRVAGGKALFQLDIFPFRPAKLAKETPFAFLVSASRFWSDRFLFLEKIRDGAGRDFTPPVPRDVRDGRMVGWSTGTRMVVVGIAIAHRGPRDIAGWLMAGGLPGYVASHLGTDARKFRRGSDDAYGRSHVPRATGAAELGHMKDTIPFSLTWPVDLADDRGR